MEATKQTPYGLSRKLKEVGFDIDTSAAYLRGELKYNGINNPFFGEPFSDIVKAPLWQEAIDWLETKHNIHIDQITSIDNDKCDGTVIKKYRLLQIITPAHINVKYKGKEAKFSYRDLTTISLDAIISTAIDFIKEIKK